MAEENKSEKISLKQLMVSTLAMTDALAKLMLAKGIITEEEIKTQLSTEWANYLAVLKRDALIGFVVVRREKSDYQKVALQGNVFSPCVPN